MRLSIVARRRDRLKAMQSELSSVSRKSISVLEMDLSLPNSCEDLLREAIRLGPIQMLVNNAGFGPPGSFAETTWSDLERTILLNSVTPTHLCHLFLPHLLQTGGKVINISSMAASYPLSNLAVYSSTKAQLRSLSLALDEAYKAKGVRVHCILPGAMDTEFPRPPGIQGSSVAPIATKILHHVLDKSQSSCVFVPKIWDRIGYWVSCWIPDSNLVSLADGMIKKERTS